MSDRGNASSDAFHYRIHDDPPVFTVSDTAAEAAEGLGYDVTAVFCTIGVGTERVGGDADE